MKLHKRYLSGEINPRVLEIVCQHYMLIHSRLVRNPNTVRGGHTEEDILQIAIIQVSQEVTEQNATQLIEQVELKFKKLLKGFKIRESSIKEIGVTEQELEYYGNNIQTEEEV